MFVCAGAHATYRCPQCQGLATCCAGAEAVTRKLEATYVDEAHACLQLLRCSPEFFSQPHNVLRK